MITGTNTQTATSPTAAPAEHPIMDTVPTGFSPTLALKWFGSELHQLYETILPGHHKVWIPVAKHEDAPQPSTVVTTGTHTGTGTGTGAYECPPHGTLSAQEQATLQAKRVNKYPPAAHKAPLPLTDTGEPKDPTAPGLSPEVQGKTGSGA